MQDFSFAVPIESPLYPISQPFAVSDVTQSMGTDPQYFQTAQMKLHAREQRLQVQALRKPSSRHCILL